MITVNLKNYVWPLYKKKKHFYFISTHFYVFFLEIGNTSERQNAIGKQAANIHNSFLTFTYERIYKKKKKNHISSALWE